MKKFVVGICAILMTFIFVGCSNEVKTLARNLDSTITNLMYSVSNLDLLDENSFSQVKSITNSFNNQIQDNAISQVNNNNNTNNNLLNQNCANNNCCNKNNYIQTSTSSNISQINIEDNDLINENEPDNLNNEANNENTITNYETDNQDLDSCENCDDCDTCEKCNQHNNREGCEECKIENNSQIEDEPAQSAMQSKISSNNINIDNNQDDVNIINKNKIINNANIKHNNKNNYDILDNNSNIAEIQNNGLNKKPPKKFQKPSNDINLGGIENNSSLNDLSNNNQSSPNAIINNENIQDYPIQDEVNKTGIVSNGTETDTSTIIQSAYSSLESTSNRIQSLINDLVNVRTVIMLYISDLYNGNISLSQEDINAINSYANIIKESTAYLRSNKGMVHNHINEANNFLNDTTNSYLANSHIIRATETLNTRCAKLEAAILATYNIVNLIKNNLNIDDTSNSNSSDLVLDGANGNVTSALSVIGGNGIFGQNSPNYYVNNPYNMGVNGMNYANFGSYPYPINYGPYGENMLYNNFYPYGINMNSNFGYGMPYGNNFSYGNNVMPYREFGYGNMGYNGIYPNYNINNGFLNNPYGNEIFNEYPVENENNLGLIENNIGITNNGTTMPNVLTGLVSNDDQEHLSDIELKNIEENKICICSAKLIEEIDENDNIETNDNNFSALKNDIDPEFSFNPKKPNYHNGYRETTKRIYEKYRKNNQTSQENVNLITENNQEDIGYLINLNEQPNNIPYTQEEHSVSTLEYII